MGSSKKAGKAPAPLRTSSSGDAHWRHDSFGSVSSDSTYEYTMGRSDTQASAKSSTVLYPRTYSSSSKTYKKPSSPTANAHTHCGRHSDQWLFGGTSMSDMIKSAWKKE